MIPGWYPDPYSPDLLRWWDGKAWTSHTAPASRAVAAGGGWQARDPQADLVKVSAAGRRAAIAVVVAAVYNIAQYFVVALVFGDVFQKIIRQVRDQIDAANEGRTVRPNFGFPSIGWWNLATLVPLVVQILMMIWLYQAASVARRARWPAKREPIWAVLGFIIPIVNFWFPYQVARDSFAPGDPGRTAAGRWWTWYLVQSLIGIPLVVVSILSTPVAVGVAAIASVVPVLAAYEARALIAAVEVSQRRALGG